MAKELGPVLKNHTDKVTKILRDPGTLLDNLTVLNAALTDIITIRNPQNPILIIEAPYSSAELEGWWGPAATGRDPENSIPLN